MVGNECQNGLLIQLYEVKLKDKIMISKYVVPKILDKDEGMSFELI